MNWRIEFALGGKGANMHSRTRMKIVLVGVAVIVVLFGGLDAFIVWEGSSARGECSGIGEQIPPSGFCITLRRRIAGR